MLLWTLTSIALAADEPAPGFSLWEMWTSAGWIARGVLIVLAIMLVASVYTGIERTIAFNRARNQSMRLAGEIVGPLRGGDIRGAKQLAADERFKASYLAALLRAGLGELETRTDKFGLSNAKRAISKAIAEENAKLRRGLTILATTGSTAPFVGLFGTTFGVINAFQGMATAGSGLASISKGISEALITTGFGIGVAVIGVWLYNYFTQRADKVGEDLAASEIDFVDWAEKLLAERGDSSNVSYGK